MVKRICDVCGEEVFTIGTGEKVCVSCMIGKLNAKPLELLFRVVDKEAGIRSGEICEIDVNNQFVSYHHSQKESGSGLCTQQKMDKVYLEVSVDQGKTWVPCVIPSHMDRKYE